MDMEEESDVKVLADMIEKRSEKSTDSSMEEQGTMITSGGGTKRKMESDDDDDEEEDEEDDLGYYDSSDDPDFCEETVIDVEDKEAWKDVEPVPELYDSDGESISDSVITMWMEEDPRSDEEKQKLMPKIKRYLFSLQKSEGFDCIDFPGVIWGLTQVIPCNMSIAHRDRLPEGYNHFFYMASLAIKDYNEKNRTGYKVSGITRSMFSSNQGRTYNITFTAACNGVIETFLANVWVTLGVMEMEVIYCEKKPSSPSLLVEKEMSDRSTDEESSDNSSGGQKDLLEIISELNSYSNAQLMELFKNTKKDKNMLLKDVRKYFDSILKSQGFKCRHYPGHIPGLSYLKPRVKVLEGSKRNLVCYYHARLMAELAKDYYFRDEKKFVSYSVKNVESLNLWKKSSSCYIFYVTFIVLEVKTGKETTFEAKVQDNQHSINVISCSLAR